MKCFIRLLRFLGILIVLSLTGCAGLDCYLVDQRVDRLTERVDSLNKALKRADVGSPFNFQERK